MPKESTPSLLDLRRPLAAAFLSLAVAGAGSAHARDEPVSSRAEAGARSGDVLRGVDTDSDGDGLPELRQAGGGDLKDLHPPSGKVDAGNALNGAADNARVGDPIPGIDITCAPTCGDRREQASDPTAGDADAGSDPTAKSVPALEANPLP